MNGDVMGSPGKAPLARPEEEEEDVEAGEKLLVEEKA